MIEKQEDLIKDTEEEKKKRQLAVENIISNIVDTWSIEKDFRKLRVDLGVPQKVKIFIRKICTRYGADQINVESDVFNSLMNIGLSTISSLSALMREEEKRKGKEQQQSKEKGNPKNGENIGER